MTEKRKFYMIRMSAVFANRKRAAEHAKAEKMEMCVFRADEGGYRAVELWLAPPYSEQRPFEISEQERSRLEAEITHARLMTAKPAKPPVEYIDMTPTWLAILPILLEGLSDRATHEAGIIAKEELIRMARAADAWNAHCKGSK